MTLRAYQKAQAAAESPRQTEHRLFGQVTAALIDAKRTGVTGTRLVEAIDWNRRVWSTLAIDCMHEGNQLTRELRAQIVSLSIFVSKYSSKVMQEGASLDPLIDINRTIMEGLKQAA
jgi:flagellar protein FlaF